MKRIKGWNESGVVKMIEIFSFIQKYLAAGRRGLATTSCAAQSMHCFSKIFAILLAFQVQVLDPTMP